MPMASVDSALPAEFGKSELMPCRPSPAPRESPIYPGKYIRKHQMPVPVFPG
jgi:hypothetical protein